MNKFILTILLFSFLHASAGKPDAKALLKEGKMLCRLEKASWYATDQFLAAFKHKAGMVGGYLSYFADDGNVCTIFFGTGGQEGTNIITAYRFGADPDLTNVTIDSTIRRPTETEAALIELKQSALDLINENEGNFFSFYKGTSVNLIPVIEGNKKKVYMLTAPKQAGKVLLGNDYLLTFTKNLNLKTKKKLHNTIIELPYENSDKIITATMHTHVLSNHIEVTDICTLLLNKEFVSWKQHYVIHKDYVSVLDLGQESLFIMTRKAFENIGSGTMK